MFYSYIILFFLLIRLYSIIFIPANIQIFFHSTKRRWQYGGSFSGRNPFSTFVFSQKTCFFIGTYPRGRRSDRQGEVDGVGGAGVGGAEEGVEVERVGVGLRDCRSGFLLGVWDGLEPFGREDGGDEAGGTGNGGGETAGAEGGEVDEEVELVGGTAAIDTTVESDGKDIAVDGGRSDFHSLHRAATDDDAREVDLAVGSKAILVEVLEDGVGAVLLPNGMPVEADEVCLLHVGRELGYYREVAAMGLLRLGLRVGHRGGHGALALPPMPSVVYLIA